MEFLSSIPSYVFAFIAMHLELFLGYVICVIFPIPWLNSKIIDLWAKLLKKTPDQNEYN